MKKIELSENFTAVKIMLYALPAIISIIVTTSFGLVDGYFVSNLLGVDQFAAVNLVFPVLTIFPAAGYMIGSGGALFLVKVITGQASTTALITKALQIPYTSIPPCS